MEILNGPGIVGVDPGFQEAPFKTTEEPPDISVPMCILNTNRWLLNSLRKPLSGVFDHCKNSAFKGLKAFSLPHDSLACLYEYFFELVVMSVFNF